MILFLFATHLLFTGTRSIRISGLDFILLGYVIYILTHWLFIKPVAIHPLKLFEFGFLVCIYLYVRILPQNKNYFLFGYLVLSSIVLSIWGVLQHFGLIPSLHNEFNITGSFFNPAPYAGFLVSVLPVWFMFFKSEGVILSMKTNAKKVLTILLIIFFCLQLFVLVLSGSRAAWLALVTSGIIFIRFFLQINTLNSFSNHLIIPDNVKAKKLFKRLIFRNIIKIVVIACSVFFLFFAVYKLYRIRENSVSGRFLIWKVATQMITDHPIAGIGFGQFEAKYMHAQAVYLEQKGPPHEKYLAGNTIFCFNEYLRTWVEFGLPGLVLALSVVAIALLGKTHVNSIEILTARAGIATILVFAFFSYPASVLPIKTVFVIFLAFLAKNLKSGLNSNPIQLNNRIPFRLLTIFLLAIPFLFAVQKAYSLTNAYSKWKIAEFKYYESPKEGLKLYESVYPELKQDGQYLAMYANTLKNSKKYKEAISIYTEAASRLPVNEIYTGLGNCHESLGNFGKAEENYKYSIFLAPVMARPVFMLAKLYKENGQDSLALTTIARYWAIPLRKKAISTFEHEYKMKKLEEEIKKR